MKILYFFLVMLVSGQALAFDLPISCQAPTTYIDGTPIVLPIFFNLYGGKAGAPKTKLVALATSCNFIRTNVSVGTQEYYVTAVVSGMESAPTPTGSYVVTATSPTPNAPTNLKIG